MPCSKEPTESEGGSETPFFYLLALAVKSIVFAKNDLKMLNCLVGDCISKAIFFGPSQLFFKNAPLIDISIQMPGFEAVIRVKEAFVAVKIQAGFRQSPSGWVRKEGERGFFGNEELSDVEPSRLGEVFFVVC